jgi:hypothetical protein
VEKERLLLLMNVAQVAAAVISVCIGDKVFIDAAFSQTSFYSGVRAIDLAFWELVQWSGV